MNVKTVKTYAEPLMEAAAGEEKGFKPKKARSFEDTHERILRMALEVFSRRGFKGATTRELAAEAEVSEVTLYRHFESKEAIFEEIAKRFSIIPVLENIPAEIYTKPLAEKLKFIAGKFFGIFRERSSMMRIMFSEAIVHKEQAKMLFENIPLKALRLISKLFESEIAAGNVKKIDPGIIARLFLGLLFSYNMFNEMLYGKEYEEFDEGQVIETLVEVYMKGIEAGRGKEESGRGKSGPGSKKNQTVRGKSESGHKKNQTGPEKSEAEVKRNGKR